MKTIALLFLTTGLLSDPKTELGPGIVEVDIGRTIETKVFKNKGDKHPEKVIRLIKENGEIVMAAMILSTVFSLSADSQP